LPSGSIVSHWTAFHRCALAALVALAAACASLNGAPAPIPADQVLAPGANHVEAMRAEFRVAAGGEQLRGFLSDE
jgi:hypothetical protein